MAEQIPLLPSHTWEAPDELTAVARLEAPWSPFPAALAHWICSIVPQRSVEEQGLVFFDQPVGSGPFVLDSWDDAWEHGARIVLRRNPSFREAGKPYLDQLVLVNVLDPQARPALLQSGELDAADVLPYDSLAALQSDPGLTLLDSANATVRFCNINTSRPPFDDVNLRKAMNHAIDKQALIDAIAAGHGEPANTYLAKVPQHNDAAPGFPFDMAKARELAANSAGKGGFSAELIVRDVRPLEIACANLVKEQLAEIGGMVTVAAVDPEEFGARIGSDRYDLSFDTWWPAYPDPELITRISVYGKSGNAARYANPEVDALYEASLRTTDPAEYDRIYKDLQARVNEDAPFLLLFHDGPSGAARRSVRDFRMPFSGPPRLWEVWRDDL
jgi:peptide/nickel transport system substrate-binding protein